jgi:putative NIF3 family GTP cyclohydrolase 1 type 2
MPALTAGDVVNRMKAVLAVQGVPWSDASTRDRFKFGGPDTVVTGIATTFMGTFEAITKASALGLNLIIPHEDTYWNDADNTLIAEADPLVYKTKVDFMTAHNIVIFRNHDHMHRQRPDFTFSGTAREVGLDPMTETAPNSHRFVIPETTLGELAARVKRVRGDDAIRVVGDPAAKVSRIATGAGMATPAVNAPGVDVVIGGEQREIEGTFDSPEYVMDAATLGIPKGWIVIGHNMSEESGMQEMADWLRPIVPEVKVQHVRAGIVYWVPK